MENVECCCVVFTIILMLTILHIVLLNKEVIGKQLVVHNVRQGDNGDMTLYILSAKETSMAWNSVHSASQGYISDMELIT